MVGSDVCWTRQKWESGQIFIEKGKEARKTLIGQREKIKMFTCYLTEWRIFAEDLLGKKVVEFYEILILWKLRRIASQLYLAIRRGEPKMYPRFLVPESKKKILSFGVSRPLKSCWHSSNLYFFKYSCLFISKIEDDAIFLTQFYTGMQSLIISWRSSGKKIEKKGVSQFQCQLYSIVDWLVSPS